MKHRYFGKMAKVNGFTIKAMEGKRMSKVGSYDAYRNSYQNYDVLSQSKAQQGTASVAKTSETASAKPVELSREAKGLLKELQQKYGNMDIIVGDYENEEEAAAYLARGTKEYSVLLGAKELEEMAKDKSVKKEYMDKIEGARNQLADLQTQLKEAGENVTKMGVVFEKDGTASLFASLEKTSEQQKERIEEAREAKRSERKSAYHKVKQTTVKAKTPEELLKKIQGVDWNKVEEKEVPMTGGRFDTLS